MAAIAFFGHHTCGFFDKKNGSLPVNPVKYGGDQKNMKALPQLGGGHSIYPPKKG
jgi:hypothetical protein